MKNRAILLCIACLLLAGSAYSQRFPFWGAKKAQPPGTPPDSLRRGQFTWEPNIAPQGPMLMIVSLDEQRAYTYRNGLLIGVATVSTGKKGHATPTGVFTTTYKDLDHHSNKYNNASMPYTQRITNNGVALHAGGLPGYPSSHGCIHLPSEYARLLFQASPLGMTVVITSTRTAPQEVNHPAFLTPVNVKGKAEATDKLTSVEQFRWQPERSKTGPLSIIISRPDQRMIVMRNGVEIGRSRVSIKDGADSIGTTILVAHQIDSAALDNLPADGSQVRKWIGLNFDIKKAPDSTLQNPLNDKRITIPDDFLTQVLPAITAGTSLVVTDAPILEHTTGRPLTLLTSSPGNP